MILKDNFHQKVLIHNYFQKIKQMKKVYSLVPISAITGEGIPDLLALMVYLTQKWMKTKLNVSSEVECTIMEVKTEEGLGTTIDAILSNGTLKVGDKILLATPNGAIESNIRTILTPHPLRELRVKNEYINHKEIKAAMGIKIVANNLENVIAGTNIMRIEKSDTLDIIQNKKELLIADIDNLINSIDCNEKGVYVKASTLGSLEAFISLLKEEKIPFSGVGIGSIHKKDILKVMANMEKDNKLYSVIFAFNIKVSKEIEQLAEKNGITILTGEIIYNIVDNYKKYVEKIKSAKKEILKDQAIFPCHLEMMGKKFIFNNKNPFVFGVRVIKGRLLVGTPLICPDKNVVLGIVTSIEREHNKVEVGKEGMELCIKVETEDLSITFGRHLNDTENLYSNITRESIDCLKEYYRDDVIGYKLLN